MADEKIFTDEELAEAIKNVPKAPCEGSGESVAGKIEDLYGKEVSFEFDSDEADEEHESWFYFLVEDGETTLEIEFTKEGGIELLKAMAQALGAKKMRIEVEF